MANEHENLTSLFTDIADAIREKTGGTDAIVADQFPTAIAGIEAGGSFPNGTVWTQSDFSADFVNSVYNAGGLWVAGGGNGLYYSTDGKNWTKSSAEVSGVQCVRNANGIWVASDEFGTYYSTDGKTWTRCEGAGALFHTIINANGIWVASSWASGLYYSADGKAWTQSNVTDPTQCLCNGNGVWYAGVGEYVYRSEDGVSWTRHQHFPVVQNLHYANGIVLLCGEHGLYYLDQESELFQPCEAEMIGYLCTYNANGVWVAAAGVGSLYYSFDGISWVLSNIVSEGFWTSSIYNANGVWVACTSSGLYYSYDGMTWSQSNVAGRYTQCVHNANGIWVSGAMLTDDAGVALYSVGWEP